MRLRAALAASLLFTTCADSASELKRNHTRTPRRERADLRVSLIRLIADPLEFHGQYVLTCGFLSFEEEGAVLLLSEADHRSGFTTNSIGITFGHCRDFDVDWKPVSATRGSVLQHDNVCAAGVFTAAESTPGLCALSKLFRTQRSADGGRVFEAPVTGD